MELDGWPAGLVSVRGEDDRVKTFAEGFIESGFSKKARAGKQVRIGSNTKTLTAVDIVRSCN